MRVFVFNFSNFLFYLFFFFGLSFFLCVVVCLFCFFNKCFLRFFFFFFFYRLSELRSHHRFLFFPPLCFMRSTIMKALVIAPFK